MVLQYAAKENREGFTMKLPWGGDTSYSLESFRTFAERWEEVCYDLRVSIPWINQSRETNIIHL